MWLGTMPGVAVLVWVHLLMGCCCEVALLAILSLGHRVRAGPAQLAAGAQKGLNLAHFLDRSAVRQHCWWLGKPAQPGGGCRTQAKKSNLARPRGPGPAQVQPHGEKHLTECLSLGCSSVSRSVPILAL